MAITWENAGTCRDLSGLLHDDPITALTPTSQAAGNMMSSNKAAMTAPGGIPVDPLPPSKDQGDVEIDVAGPVVKVSTSGKPPDKAGPLSQSRPAWGKVTTPDVVRET